MSPTLVSVENITPFGIWLFVKDKEYFLSYKDYPYFKDQTLCAVQNVKLLHGFHLYWPELDVDLELDNLENPEKYPLKNRAEIVRETSSKGTYSTSVGRKEIVVGALKKSRGLHKVQVTKRGQKETKRLSKRRSSIRD